MRNTKSLEIKVGVVSLLAIIILIAGISFGNNLSFGSTNKTIKLHFPNSNGIKKSSPISINGHESGRVEEVKPFNNGVEIIASITNNSDLREDASAIILLKEITGGKIIEISPGISNNKFNYNNVLYGKSSTDIGNLVAILGDVSGDAVSLLRRLDTITYSINRLFVDDDFGAKLNNSLTNLDSVSEKVKLIIDKNYNNINYSIENIKSLTSDLKTFMKDKPEKIDSLLDNFNNLALRINQFVDDADPTLKEINDLISNMNSVVTEIKEKKGLIGRLINDDDFAKSFEEAISELNSLVQKINNHGINVNARLGTRPKEKK
jgi:phospholipid/cholesterol/gamma-HCH transport system substrate-binding protein